MSQRDVRWYVRMNEMNNEIMNEDHKYRFCFSCNLMFEVHSVLRITIFVCLIISLVGTPKEDELRFTVTDGKRHTLSSQYATTISVGKILSHAPSCFTSLRKVRRR